MNLPVLRPTDGEVWQVNGHVTASSNGYFRIRQGTEYAYLQACIKLDDRRQMRKLAFALYTELMDLVDELEMSRFVRIWNYIPEITVGEGDDETYRQFCWGRADALQDRVLPAATGIGARDGWLRVGALCTTTEASAENIQITHLENPRQLSAYRYPRDYGPRSPSFARATLVQAPEHGTGLLLLSGTASIVNHESQHAGDLNRQSEETARNINALLATLERPYSPLAVRYYLRDATRLQNALDCFKADFPSWPLPAFYSADICRAELDLEIEAVFSV